VDARKKYLENLLGMVSNLSQLSNLVLDEPLLMHGYSLIKIMIISVETTTATY
jgi:hypothetical protein